MPRQKYSAPVLLLLILVFVQFNFRFSNVNINVLTKHADEQYGFEPLLGSIEEQQQAEERCAICFFGLPRAYKSMVSHGVQKNILETNQRHGCDVFVHFYVKYEEEANGAKNVGGKLDPTEILQLEDAVSQVTPLATTRFVNDTEAQFMEKRKVEVNRYLNTYDSTGNLSYYPWSRGEHWNAGFSSNLVRQWHSIDAVFQLMERHAGEKNIKYTRVGMFRSDVMYLTPIDIMKLDKKTMDVEQNQFVIPIFEAYPVNDRMIYGPYEAVKVWSTKRFELIEERVKDPNAAGNVMHAESFMAESIFPAIENLGYPLHLNPDICFLRTRSNTMVILSDCFRRGAVREFPKDPKRLRRRIQAILGRECQKEQIMPSTTKTKTVHYYILCN